MEAVVYRTFRAVLEFRMGKTVACCIVISATLAATPVLADCQCLANGRVFHHGEFACLQLPSGPELAQCDMVQNISAWKKIQNGCPEASVPLSFPAVKRDGHLGETLDRAGGRVLPTAASSG